MISIITPTYNRARYLKNLYYSLTKQTLFNFEWIIVDDGSNDNTVDIVSEFIKKEVNFDIKYHKKANGGKHTAVNEGVKLANGNLIFIVDSDDQLTDDAIEFISKYDKKYHEKKICGFSFLRSYKNEKVIGDKYSEDEFISNYFKVRIDGKIGGDKAEVYYKNILEKYPFPVFKNEKFLSEDVVWMQIGAYYDTVYINKIIYITEYLTDGLTCNDKQHKFNSPIGSSLRGLIMLRSKGNLKFKLKGAIIYNCYIKEIKNIPEILMLNGLPEKTIIFITKFISPIFYRKWKKRV